MANNFTNDSSCSAVYRFESGALTTDSKGTNTLTASSPGAASDTSTFNEGSGSTRFTRANGDFFYRLDSDLSSDFPLKSGTSNKTISVFGRFRFNTALTNDAYVVFSRSTDTGGSHRTLYCSLEGDGSSVMTAKLRIGNLSGGFFEQVSHASSLSTGTWYRILWTYKDSDKTYSIRIRNDDGTPTTLGTDLTGTSGTDGILLSSASDMMIGARGDHTATAFLYADWMDEVVIFNTVKTSTDLNNLAKGTYVGANAFTLTASSSSYTTTGTDTVLRTGSTTYLRYRK